MQYLWEKLKRVALDNLDFVKRNNILCFFKEKFNIDLEKYNDEEIKLIYHEINDKIDQVIDEELKKKDFLTEKLRLKQINLLNLVNQYADIMN